MRIVGGEARGRKIQAPEGRETRPTSERVREAVYSILGGRMDDETVLDVFSGSGAMALEAISRGAKKAVLIDSSRNAANVIRKNISALGYEKQTSFINRDWKQAFATLAGEKFSAVIIDPPYKQVAAYTEVLEQLAARNMLENGARLVLEHELKTEWEGFPEGFAALKPHKYGDTALTVLKYEGAQDSARE